MGLVASLFSALKAEVEWLITSLAVATGTDNAVSGDSQAADITNTSHRDPAPDSHSAIPTLVDQHAVNSTPDHSGVAHANSDDTLNARSIAPVADIATGHPANLLMVTDFIIDTTDNSGPAPSPGLTPISFESSASDLSGISAIVGAPADQDFYVTRPENDIQHGISTAHPDAGEFALVSLVPQMHGDFQHGGGTAGGQNGSGSGSGAPQYISENTAGTLELVLNFDSSVSRAAGTPFVADMQAVADFFTSNFTSGMGTKANPTIVTIDVGYGEVGGSHLGNGALAESEATYWSVGTGSSGYSKLQQAFQNSKDPVSFPDGTTDPLSGNQIWYVTQAEGKSLGLVTATGVDGYVGLGTGTSTWSWAWNPASVGPTQYDFESTAAHEISEVLGRVTTNGGKYFGGKSPEYMPLDLFHFSAPGVHTYAGAATGYFSTTDGNLLSNGSPNPDDKYFNTNGSGDFSDWAINASPAQPDSFDWSGGKGAAAPVSYTDYLAMEAVGWIGVDSTFSAWG